MFSRRTLFTLSFLLALALHLALLYFAPEIILMSRNANAAKVVDVFQIEIRDDVPILEPAPPPAPTELLTRPGAMRDLLEQPSMPLTQDFLTQHEPAATPNLQERIQGEAPSREYDLQQEAERLRRVDAKILEIAKEDARRELTVARRLVRPSSDRILGPDEFPSLRSSLGDAPPDALKFDLPTVSLLSEEGTPLGMPARMEPAGLPQGGGGTAESGGAASAEARVDRASYERAVEQAREESPHQFMDDMLDIELTTYIAPGEPQGYFRVRLIPKQDAKVELLPKEVIFVIDSSSSIAEQKLRETVRGVQEALKQLRPEDRFNIVAFRDTPSSFRPAAVAPNKEHLAEAEKFLAELQSRGETDIYTALLPVLGQMPPPGQPRIVLVLSDGRPTTGIQDSRAIINGLSADNENNNSIFAFGGGNTVNQPMLDLLAYRNKGAAQVVNDIADMDTGLNNFVSLLRDPLLVNLQADYGRIEDSSVFPARLPDFYRAQVVSVYGRFDTKSPEPFTMRLTGRAGERSKEVVFRADLAKAQQGTAEIARMWGFQKAYALIGQMSIHGETPELLTQLRELSSKYGFKTSYDN